MQLVFLEAATLLTKSFTHTTQGIEKTPYPFTWEFTSHIKSVLTLQVFEQELRTHAARGHCLLKGLIGKPLVKESRAGSTNTTDLTEWICLDFDDVPGLASIGDAMKLLGLDHVSHLVQYSASAGIENQNLRAHVFLLLDKPTSAPLLKQWLIHLNHSISVLRDAMTLTKTNNAIRWPLDISACQNDKLLYIAPPVLTSIADPFRGKQRITLVKRKVERLSITGTFSAEKNKELTHKRIAELRDAQGLPKRKFTYKLHGSVEILAKPDAATITEMKEERGFVYFNLNGGDSWAYYHPQNNPDFIFNFKGEPAYLTKELLPEYWEELTQNAGRPNPSGVTFLAFCDRSTSTYWRGSYDAQADHLELFKATTETQVRHFAKQHGLPLGDFIPEWDLVFNPKDSIRVDWQHQVINTFAPTQYMKNLGRKQPKAIPSTIFRVIDHALGNDPDIFEHFINWLAFIAQEREMTGTAWVLHGCEGTGKGIIATKMLRPLFGQEQVSIRRMEELNEHYNAFMRNSLIVVMDEVQTSALGNEGAVMAKLRSFITDTPVPIREMRAVATACPNFSNWIFNSNKPDPVSIPKGDRRFNVAKYQTQRLVISPQEVDGIEKELQTFFDYLIFYPCDHAKARQVLDTADRQTMISISESSVDAVSSALLEGRFDFLIDQLPASTQYLDDFQTRSKLENFKHTLRALIQRTDAKSRKCNISREELRVIFEYVSGSMPTTPNKFTSLLKHHRIHITKVWIDRTTAGIQVLWQEVKSFPAYAQVLNATPVPAQNNVVPIQVGGKKKTFGPKLKSP